MFKVTKTVYPLFFSRYFIKHEQNIYSETTEFNIPLVKMVYDRLEGLSYLGRKVWQMMSVEYKDVKSLLEFKTKIKAWKIRIDALAKFAKITFAILDVSKF